MSKIINSYLFALFDVGGVYYYRIIIFETTETVKHFCYLK